MRSMDRARGRALRTSIDVRGVGRVLEDVHGLDVVYVSMHELAHAALDAAGDLWLPRGDGAVGEGAKRLSVIYSRYDFSHPLGSYTASLDEVPAELRAEWDTVEKIEMSRAVISSTLGCRLAHRLASRPSHRAAALRAAPTPLRQLDRVAPNLHADISHLRAHTSHLLDTRPPAVRRRGVQRALRRAGCLETFVPAGAAAALRCVMPEQWHLGMPEERAEAEQLLAKAAASGDLGGFVAKNALRPRTGSGATQDRRASGGVIVSELAELRALLADDERCRRYILYRKVCPLPACPSCRR